ncbi:hypothetical protein DBR06_SOUSAS3410044, partial [Sousa chinensis]
REEQEMRIRKRDLWVNNPSKFIWIWQTKYILLIACMCYYLMGAKIFQALETDIQQELKNSFLDAETALMKNYVNITSEELEIFLQVRDKGVSFG